MTQSKQSLTKRIKLEKLKANPNNPRSIRDHKFQKLVKSLREFPEMLDARPIVVNPEMVVLGGNMRLQACIEAGMVDAPVYIATWDEVQQKSFIIKDNISYGEWDWDMLANEWDYMELDDMGMDLDPAMFSTPQDDQGLGDLLESKFNDYTIYFSNEEEMDVWYEFVKLLKTRFEGHDNVSDRIMCYLREVYEDNQMKDSQLILKFVEYDIKNGDKS